VYHFLANAQIQNRRSNGPVKISLSPNLGISYASGSLFGASILSSHCLMPVSQISNPCSMTPHFVYPDNPIVPFRAPTALATT